MILRTVRAAIVGLLLGGCVLTYLNSRDTAAAQRFTCQLRHAGRASENREMRAPVKAALAYLGQAVLDSARLQPDPVKRAAAVRFGNRYLGYAAAIHRLPNPPC